MEILGYEGTAVLQQLYQEVVTSFHFVKTDTNVLRKLLGFEPTPAGPSHKFSLML